MELTVQYFDGCPSCTELVRRLRELTAERRDVTIRLQVMETAEYTEQSGSNFLHTLAWTCEGSNHVNKRDVDNQSWQRRTCAAQEL